MPVVAWRAIPEEKPHTQMDIQRRHPGRERTKLSEEEDAKKQSLESSTRTRLSIPRSMETRASMSELDHDTARHSPRLNNPTLSAHATAVPRCCSGYPGSPPPGLSAGAPCQHCVPPVAATCAVTAGQSISRVPNTPGPRGAVSQASTVSRLPQTGTRQGKDAPAMQAVKVGWASERASGL
ncbi:hypothetical protein BGZ61DRAFT_473202 [Ilyonectria robusta]|uniref:uncharacterized protein n=1 Tax=Ilyonectria robusta TaxID=1079257 RepID=UPI001E8DC702|nr:uncharacterized protein BGZ61DRAFT_473202 [Ilyonectria robusta]KAH8734471.1 hypothetical protein BGZ61DRAFT_473202 [Ilyonectria robusta]